MGRIHVLCALHWETSLLTNQGKSAMMFTVSVLIAACFTLVSPQLAPVQHMALMDLYDALGSKRKKKEKKNC